MNKALTTAAIGSGLLVLIGLAFVRRRSDSAIAPATEHGIPDRRASPESLAPGGRGHLGLSVSVLPAQGTEKPESPSSEGFPDFQSRRAFRHDQEDFWGDLGELLEVRPKIEPGKYRAKVSAMTAEYLGLSSSRAVVFDRTAARATEEIGRAWKIRNESIEALPAALDLEERERHEREIQEGYEAAKTQALARLESLLESSPRHEQFRRRLGEWVDAVR